MAGVAIVSYAPSAHNWQGVRVFITGHTGFKGAWLAYWLAHLGAKVYGYALPPLSGGVFEQLNIEKYLVKHHIADLSNIFALQNTLQLAAPEVVFHLAAQPLVLPSYQDPISTYATNVMGTVHVLDAIRHVPSVRAVVCVTTDKCYLNTEQGIPFLEDDPLGGYDPYSASKAASEIIIDSYRRAFLQENGVFVASARAGNVIGGGDVAPHRLLPDIVRAAALNQPVLVRAPNSQRPWQHVLEALRGYLFLAGALREGFLDAAQAFNFAPRASDTTATVWQVATQFAAGIAAPAPQLDTAGHAHEAVMLQLSGVKAQHILNYQPLLSLYEALHMTIEWTKAPAAQKHSLSEQHLERMMG